MRQWALRAIAVHTNNNAQNKIYTTINYMLKIFAIWIVKTKKQKNKQPQTNKKNKKTTKKKKKKKKCSFRSAIPRFCGGSAENF